MRGLALCAALSCAPAQSLVREEGCLTRCGLKAPGNCAELQALEDRTVSAFGALDWGGPRVVCAALGGWTLRTHASRPSDGVACGAGAWLLAAGFCVRGYTHVEVREIELLDRDWSKSVLPHELVHVLDVALKGKAGHCGWEERGIKDALLWIQGRPDTGIAESSCP